MLVIVILLFFIILFGFVLEYLNVLEESEAVSKFINFYKDTIEEISKLEKKNELKETLRKHAYHFM